MPRPSVLPALALIVLTAGCSSKADDIVTTGRFRGEAWADNWFSLHVGDELVVEDSVPITTERSFNMEVFGFDAEYPLVLNFTLKDFKENDTGLEYIGTDKQQMGDGGFIAQIKDTTTDSYVAVSSSAWRCLVVHRGPTNTDCEKSANPAESCQSESITEPADWKSADFDTSSWAAASEYTTGDVSPKEGYDEVSWDSSASLIWSSSLKQDNTLLCKAIVQEP